MSEDVIVWSTRERFLYGLRRAAGVGLIIGAFEGLVAGFGLRLPMGLVDHVAFLCVSIAVNGLVGVLVGLLLGLPIHVLLRREVPSLAIGAHAGAFLVVLTGLQLWPLAMEVWGQDRVLAACFVGFMPLFVGLVGFLNGAWLVRRMEGGAVLPVRFWWVVAGTSGLVSAAGLAINPFRSTGGEDAAPSASSVLLISVDTLRRDHVGAYGVPTDARTPRLDALAAEGTLFLDAVTPMPETAPAHGSVFVGVEPTRHGLLSNGHQLQYGGETLAQIFEKRGFATGAFVSSFALDRRTGLDAGFRVYDDDLPSTVPGLLRLRALQVALRLWVRLGDPAATPWILERAGDVTVDHFAAWLDEHEGQPFFGFVHLFEPHAPYEHHGVPGFEANASAQVNHRGRMAPTEEWTPSEQDDLRALYAEEVAEADRIVGRILDVLEERSLSDETLVVFFSDHGEMLGEHGLTFHHHGLYEGVTRVPLILRIPGGEASRVAAQVRLQDIRSTVLDFSEVDADLERSVSLLPYAEAGRGPSLRSSLVGRPGRARGHLVGVRMAPEGEPDGRVKFVRHVEEGTEALFDLVEDPGEHVNVLQDRTDADALRELVLEDAVRVELLESTRAASVAPGEQAMLEALGYQE